MVSPGMLRKVKLSILKTGKALGVFSMAMSSEWRRRRLLILCYHGVSLADEHEWSPAMFVTLRQFRSRMQIIKERGCTVLPLGDAIQRLHSGTLPERSVAITFDDGFYDFYTMAWPLLKEFSYPATVYLTTYHVDHWQWPVFDLMIGYALWKSRGRRLVWPEMLLDVTLDSEGRNQVQTLLQADCLRKGLSGAEKHGLLRDLCHRIDFDFARAAANRILGLMSNDEIRRIASEGADIQLHTHRHRVFARKERFWQEIDDNRTRIRSVTQTAASHFCYPGGYTLETFPEWLREREIVSATTCHIGLAAPSTNPYLLPRLLDTAALTDDEFDAWLCGAAEFLPRQADTPHPSQLGQEPEGPFRTAGGG